MLHHNEVTSSRLFWFLCELCWHSTNRGSRANTALEEPFYLHQRCNRHCDVPGHKSLSSLPLCEVAIEKQMQTKVTSCVWAFISHQTVLTCVLQGISLHAMPGEAKLRNALSDVTQLVRWQNKSGRFYKKKLPQWNLSFLKSKNVATILVLLWRI